MDSLIAQYEIAVVELNNAKTRLHFVTVEASQAKYELEVARTEALLNPNIIDGKNAEVREAQLLQHLPSEHKYHQQKEEQLITAKYQHDVAQLEIDRLKFILRTLELTNNKE